jgi:hypothetical protein
MDFMIEGISNDSESTLFLQYLIDFMIQVEGISNDSESGSTYDFWDI